MLIIYSYGDFSESLMKVLEKCSAGLNPRVESTRALMNIAFLSLSDKAEPKNSRISLLTYISYKTCLTTLILSKSFNPKSSLN